MPIHDIINYSTSICLLEPRSMERKGKKIQNCEYLKNEKSFLDEIKTFFIAFERLSSGEKIKL